MLVGTELPPQTRNAEDGRRLPAHVARGEVQATATPAGDRIEQVDVTAAPMAHRTFEPRQRPISPHHQHGIPVDQNVGAASGEVANVYLHYSLDLWAELWRRREATGDMIIVRYADDVVVGFEHESDARRFWDAMRERLQKFSLSLHPDKTRLVEFGRYAETNRKRRGLGKPETFDFLGFTLVCSKSRRGRFLLKRRSRRDRMKAKLKDVSNELRHRMHQSIPEQGK